MASRPAPHGDDISSRTIVLIPARLGSTRLPDKPLAMIAGAPDDRAGLAPRARGRGRAGGRGLRRAGHRRGGPGCRRRGRADRSCAALRHRPDLRRPPGRRPRASLPARGQPAGRSSYARSRSPSVRCSSRSKRSAPTWPRSPTPPRTSTTCATPTWSRPWSASTADRPELGRALYFTRATAPSGPGPVWHHIGIYAFTRDALERFAALPPSPLEQRERLEQLRALENGMSIGVRLVDCGAVRRRHSGRSGEGAAHPGGQRMSNNG